jgi:hypothetical protein
MVRVVVTYHWIADKLWPLSMKAKPRLTTQPSTFHEIGSDALRNLVRSSQKIGEVFVSLFFRAIGAVAIKDRACAVKHQHLDGAHRYCTVRFPLGGERASRFPEVPIVNAKANLDMISITFERDGGTECFAENKESVHLETELGVSRRHESYFRPVRAGIVAPATPRDCASSQQRGF